MDVYKWAFKLAPLVPSNLVMDAFDLAREIRVLDMRASPYDLRELGYTPVAIETPEGKAAYIEAQRAFSQRSNALRQRLIDVIDAATLLAPSGQPAATNQPSKSTGTAGDVAGPAAMATSAANPFSTSSTPLAQAASLAGRSGRAAQ